ncbi:hypothetical protein BGZ83_000123 [Gryganskiella cystojenkinii]|nr:hypothetical protein BGZ83_000123 [Gryganskiella cystojenkinii]
MSLLIATSTTKRIPVLAPSNNRSCSRLLSFVTKPSQAVFGPRSHQSFVSHSHCLVLLATNDSGSNRYAYQQHRQKNTGNPETPDAFTRKEAAKRRLEKEDELKITPEVSAKGSKDRIENDSKKSDHAEDNPRKEAVKEKEGIKTFRPARLPVVLCHGFSGFDSLGQNPDFRFDYWYGVREALEEIGCVVHAARVPPFSGIEIRAQRLREYIERTVPHGSELNLIGHSMGGLDCRYMITHLKSPHFKIKSLTTLATPHHGSSFADYVITDIVGKVRLETFWSILKLVGIERGATENLTTHYLKNEFNPRTPNDPDVRYFSYAASFQPGFFSRFRFPWQVIMDREGPNDGLVSVKSAQWGEFIRTIPNADHMDLMNWVNALTWSRARFPWILGGASHDPEGRSKGAFEMDNNDEGDRDRPGEEPPLFNAIELYLEISDMLHEHDL